MADPARRDIDFPTGAIACARCGAPLVCTPGPGCWCAALPLQPMPQALEGCLCRACLQPEAAEGA